MKTLKNELMAIEKTSEFINRLHGLGYQESSKNGSSHRVFKKSGYPVLSIPCHNNGSLLSDGTRRNLVKLILQDEYYKK